MFIYKLHKKNYSSFYKNDTSEKIWYIQDLAGDIGPYYFSFNRKVVFNFWKDYPHFLTNRQIRIFKAENPEMAALKPTKRGGPIKEYSAKEALELIHK